LEPRQRFQPSSDQTTESPIISTLTPLTTRHDTERRCEIDGAGGLGESSAEAFLSRIAAAESKDDEGLDGSPRRLLPAASDASVDPRRRSWSPELNRTAETSWSYSLPPLASADGSHVLHRASTLPLRDGRGIASSATRSSTLPSSSHARYEDSNVTTTDASGSEAWSCSTAEEKRNSRR
jgi:hypothetical protein